MVTDQEKEWLRKNKRGEKADTCEESLFLINYHSQIIKKEIARKAMNDAKKVAENIKKIEERKKIVRVK